MALILALGPPCHARLRAGTGRHAPRRSWGGLQSQSRPLLGRSWGSLLGARASKQDQGQPAPPLPPYSDMLLQREYELWQRQSAMYEQLAAQHEAERRHWAVERERWAAQEASLRQEVAELRAQLLYVLSSAAGGGAAAADARSSTASSAGAYGPPTLPGREARQLPLGAGLTPSEQVQAVVDAVRSGSTLSEHAPAAGSSSDSGDAAPQAASLPRYAAELAAAVAAVDELDVLSDELDFGALADRLLSARRRQQQQQPGAAAPAPAVAAAGFAAPAGPVAPPPAAPPSPPQAAAPAAGPTEQAAVAAAAPPEVPAGPRPTLVSGSDDIYWVSELHRALVAAGYYPGDDDVEDFFFGDSTQSAVMTLQACEGLPETGAVDDATWGVLLALAEARSGSEDEEDEEGAGASTAAAVSADSAKPYAQLFAQAFTEQVTTSSGASVVHQVTITDTLESGGLGGAVQETLTVREEVRAVQPSAGAARTAWPVLMEGDGGKTVHALHVALQQSGYYPSDDDLRWWQFGDSTLNALKTFQACSGLPESGVADPRTWCALLGADASPAVLDTLRSENSDDEDMANSDRVWLMGEQRWEDRSRVKRK